MSNEKGKVLVFIDTRDHDGHEADFRFALARALGRTTYSIFQDFSKNPESIFSATVGGILVSQIVMLDGAPRTNKISPDSLIQYGICRALEKRCIFIGIKSNIEKQASLEVNNTIVEGYAEFDYYLDFAAQFKSDFLEQTKNYELALNVKPNKLPVHAFIAFGVNRSKNPDLYESIMSFRNGTEWTPRVVSDIGSFSKLEKLANAVSQRSFCIFCLDENENEKERVFIGIGLAIGMGRPFLIVKHKNACLPNSLKGYHGVIEYEFCSQLNKQLIKYADEFLSEKVFEWEGATYNDLLIKLEKRVGGMNPVGLTEVEGVLKTVISVLGTTVAKPYALLGEIYREKNRKISPNDVELLKKAKEYYEKAISIQKDYQLYQNAAAAIDKHIQLIELIKEKKYRSIPTLINLIGSEIGSEHYLQVKEYLLDVVNKLVEKKDYMHAISLLAAMQIHDKSEQIQNLVQKILNLAPHEIIKALQDSQKDVVNLETEKAQILDQVKEKGAQLDKISEELESYKRQMKSAKDELATANESLQITQNERDRLSAKLKDISTQLDVDQKTMTEFETKIETARSIGKQVIVNFGHPYGWAVYRAIDSEPYVIRAGKRLSAQKGLVLDGGDVICNEDGYQILELLPRDAIIVRPDDDQYEDLSNFMKDNE